MTVREESMDERKVDAAWDAAAYWTARHDAAPETAKDPRFLAWLEAEPEHRAIWSRAQTLWDEAATDLARAPMIETLSARARARGPEPWRGVIVAACALIAFAGAGALTWRQIRPARVELASAWGAPEFVTAKGDRLTERLSDGTRLQLDTDSAVDVAIDGRERRLRLVRGQVFVEVAADKRPFSLEAGGQVIVDRGTAFATRLDGATVSITLQSGEVAVGPVGRKPAHLLTPNHRLVLKSGGSAIVEEIDPEIDLAWRSGFLEFSNTPLSQAVEEMNRYGGPRLVVPDPKVAALKTTGRFKAGEPERFVANAAAVLPIKALPVGDHLEIVASRP